MFQLRDADPWAETSDTQESSAIVATGKSAVSSLFSFLTTPIGAAKDAASGGAVVTTTPQSLPGQQTKTVTPIYPKRAWYKTPLGMIGIAAGAFVGYKFYKRRKARAA